MITITDEEALEKGQPMERILKETKLVSIINRVLGFDLEEEEMYFCKLEVLWILISLSICEGEENKLILLSEAQLLN